jgi:O-antigen/teichoic acid export membrane protein
VAGRFYSSALLLLSSIHAVLAPRFANVEMLDHEKQRRFTTKWLRITLWLPLPVLGGLVLGQPLFLWVVGEQYERSFLILLVLSVGLCLSLAFSPIVNVLMARKEFKFVFGLGVLALALNVIGNLSLIPRWGGVGAAAITVVTHATVNGLSVLKVLRPPK